MYIIYLLIAAFVVAISQILIFSSPAVQTVLLWLLVIKVGCGGVWAFMGHYYKADFVAKYIGWPEGNPFQQEVAFANLGLGLCGLLCFFFRDGFWLATILFESVFLIGAFSVHVKSQKESGNKNPGNAGPIFFADILVPILLLSLYLAM